MSLEYRAYCLKILIIIKPVIIKIIVIYIQINKKAGALHDCKVQRIPGKEWAHWGRVTEQRQNIGHAGRHLTCPSSRGFLHFLPLFFFFFPRLETILLKSDYIRANSGGIFSAAVYMGIHYI